jgi:xylulokinase
MAQIILGIDVGTTSLKTAAFSIKGEKLAAATVEYSLLTPAAGFVEAPCEVYLDSIKKCLARMRDVSALNTKDISFIGFSVQGETLCFLDEEARPLRNAIVWMDNRARTQAEKMRDRFGNELCYRITGQVSFEACWPAPKIQWVRENEPDVFSRTRHIVLLEDYIIHRLTDRFVAEGSLLTSTLYWDITTKKYWPEMLAYLGIDQSMLPEIKESGELVGTILPAMAEELWVAPDAKVCTGCLDQAAGAIGVGNVKPGIFSENIGAALAVCVPTKELTYDPHRLMPVHYFAIPDTYMMHTFTTGGMCLRWFRDAFCTQEIAVGGLTGDDSYYLMDKEAESVPVGSDGLLCLPHLQGSMAPDVNLNAKAVFYGMTLKHQKPHFIRSIMESIGYIICRNLDTIDKMGLHINEIRSMGGGSKSHIWNQIKADITGKTLYLTTLSQDVACLGAAILAGVAGGVFTGIEPACETMVKIDHIYRPDMEKHQEYQRHYEKYQALFRAVSAIYALDD